MKPVVSIIMATYNRVHFIVETLQSIQNQHFQNWECLIIDDGGTDNTAEVIQPVLDKDRRFLFYKRTENHQKGLPGCRNYGLDLAQGDYIIFFDDDDIVHPQNLELCVAELSKPEISFCRYNREVFTGQFHYQFDWSKEYGSFYIDKNDVEKLLKEELPFNSCAVMWKKDCFQSNRSVEHLMYAEEWELYSRILSSGIKGISIEKTLFYGRKHPNSNTGQFFQHNAIRRKSKSDAIFLVTKNLKDKKMLSKSILRHFIQLSYGFREFGLFNQMMKIVDLSALDKFKWKLFYTTLPFRLFLYKLKKKYL